MQLDIGMFVEEKRPYASESAKQKLMHELKALRNAVASLPAGRTANIKAIGILCNAMDLERNDRLELIAVILGRTPRYNSRFIGRASECELEDGDPSLRDTNLSWNVVSRLIEYFQEDINAQFLIDGLGYERASDHRKARVAQRAIARQQKAASLMARREQKRAKKLLPGIAV